MTEGNQLSDSDLEIVRDFMMPIMRDIPQADNPKGVTLVLLMAACSMAETTFFGDLTKVRTSTMFDGVGALYESFEEARQAGDVREACISFIEEISPIVDETTVVGKTPAEKFKGWFRIR